MKASQIASQLTRLIQEHGDKDVVALGDIESDEFYEIDFIVDVGNEEHIGPYILSLDKTKE